jgi:hypothetical protein
MTILRNIFLAAALLMITGSLNAQASVLFSDNFNTENGGVGELNYNNFANWNVTDGTVDIIGNGYYDFYPGNGLYVDLDGSTGQAGTMTSKTSFDLTPGTYTLSYDLGGSQRGDINTVDINVGSLYSTSLTLDSSYPLTQFNDTFTVTSPTSANISFHNLGGDNVGDILDNVQLTSDTSTVPEPSTIWLFLFAGVMLFWTNKRSFLKTN